MKHINNGKCPRCAQIFDRYPGFVVRLRAAFVTLQHFHPEAHISCAGRGKQDQEEAVIRGASRAHYGASAHNWNAAIDIFEMHGNLPNIYERKWFDAVVKPWVESLSWLEWYGEEGARFPELPHVELRGWRQLAKDAKLKLVEDV